MISEALLEALNWRKTDDGYEWPERGAKIVRRPGKRGGRGNFILSVGDREFDLGPRATFDHAEAALAKAGHEKSGDRPGRPVPPGMKWVFGRLVKVGV